MRREDDDDGAIDGEPRRPRRESMIRLLLAAGLLLVAGGALMAALAGFGHRWGWWHFSIGYSVLRWGLYPDLVPIRLAADRETVFVAAEQLARDVGWRIVEADPVEGRIEAVDRTFWFGFRDDVVIPHHRGGRTAARGSTSA